MIYTHNFKDTFVMHLNNFAINKLHLSYLYIIISQKIVYKLGVVSITTSNLSKLVKLL